MADAPLSGTAPVVDRRPTPRGALPRSAQAWLMAAIAVGMLAIIFIAGRPQPAAVPAAGPSAQPLVPSPERLREYQERLRILDTRIPEEAPSLPAAPPLQQVPAYDPAPRQAAEDPVAADRRRREYDSLFAGNVVLSRRPESERPDTGGARTPASPASTGSVQDTAPSIDEIADAVVRATTRAGAALTSIVPPSPDTSEWASTPRPSQVRRVDIPPVQRDDDVPGLHRLVEGTVIDTVLTNRLDGGVAAPVNCLVTNPIYSPNRQHVVIPAGARVLGETRPVQGFGDARLAVAFHRLVMPDGRAYTLDDFVGLNQLGDAALRDRVNHHYWSTFGAAGAVGLISGLAQALGGLGFGAGDGDRTVVIAGSATDATAQASLQVMNRFLNRMPTITIREGHRVKIYLTGDLQLPAYAGPTGTPGF